MSFQNTLVILMLVLAFDSKVHTGEIYGGHEAAPHSRPYMVLLELLRPTKTTFCDGFLLSEDFVMTAAHCQANSYNALLGIHDFAKDDKQNISVAIAFKHEDYNITNGIIKNDIMLLKLRNKAQFNERVRPIGLPGQGDQILPKHCLVSGWGNSNKATRRMTSRLMEVNVTLIDSELCAEDHLYCSKGKTGPASGDSGGPLVCEDGLAYGVVSFTFEPHPPHAGPLIHGFTMIPKYNDWIARTISLA
ncbi:granzyme B(G,H) [Polymixia lowei]